MCTVTWRAASGGYDLFFNRDELRTRAPALPPTEALAEGVRYLAPTDTDAGGSWLAVNELGTTVGLLNAHPPAARTPQRLLSRGLLVRKLADLTGVDELEQKLSELDLERLRPFTLFAVSPGTPGLALGWDGSGLESRPLEPPFLLSSSSIESDGADGARRALLQRFLHDRSSPAAAHLGFHRSHHPDRGPLAPCMHREDARTVSFTRVEVTEAVVRIAYADGPPCRKAAAATDELRRAEAAIELRRGE